MDGEHFAGCRGKVKYKTYAEAERSMNRKLRRRSNKSYRELRMNIYKCRYCQHWHIGSEIK